MTKRDGFGNESKLFLDDIRDPLKFGYLGYTWVTTADEAIEMLKKGVHKASLDHDLDVDHYSGNYDGTAKTGYDVLLFLEEHPQYLPPGGIAVHSMNPVGRARMEKLVERLYSDLGRKQNGSD